MQGASRIALLCVAANLCLATNPGAAQDLLITNARIVVGNGETIAEGSISVADGTIVSVWDSTDATPGAAVSGDGATDGVIDARGMTVLPGFIDTHVHTMAVAEGLTDEAALAAYIEDELPHMLGQMLAAGVTTVLDTGAHFPDVLEVREALSAGRLAGPRLLAAGPAFSAPAGHPAASICRDNPFCLEHLTVVVDDPDFARTSVAALAEAGVDVIKAVHQAGAHLPVIRDEVIGAMAEEAEARNVPFYVHGTFFSGMVRAAELGVDGFVHVPWRDQADAATSEAVFASAGIPIATTVSLHDSFVDAEGIKRTVMGGTFPPAQDGDRAQAVANAGVLSDAGVSLAFGTDQQRARPYPQAVLGEARALAEVMTPEQVIAVLTRNAAEFLNLGEELGTLEAGKYADMVILDGDPLADISQLANVAVVVQAGRIVVDAR
ncbi:MAG: amidohydrolase family protein [Rhodospirillaceae bacterium]|nr:amidohydrolase family protein [Rhodospirillaceae bacterium]MDE0361595.1 amidohydrolase family protein [Rhodospirillaceae bacterium]